jgi:methylenetetrahydrofolate reductase (NADPH)
MKELVTTADFELIPLRSADEKLAAVPAGTSVTVTTSTKIGLERTLDYAVSAARTGHRVVPHLAARQVASQDDLGRFLRRLEESGIVDLYVIAGDAPEPAGPYTSSLALLRAIEMIDHHLESIGVACYPEGHPSIADDDLRDALDAKQPIADYMVSQMCFDGQVLIDWLRATRADGIDLPLHVGLAGPLALTRLAALSTQIGVGSSIGYLTKQHGLLKRLLPGNAYQPERLLREVTGALDFDALGVDGVHLFTFNQVAKCVDWQRQTSGSAAVR